MIISAYIGATIDYTYRVDESKKIGRNISMGQLANNLFIIDAINIDKLDDAKLILYAEIKKDLFNIIQTNNLVEKNSEGVFPCALVKKIRQFKNDGIINFSKDDQMDTTIVGYMTTNCLGKPTKKNIAR